MCTHNFCAVSNQQNWVCIECGLVSTINNYSVEDARFEICIRQTFTKVSVRFYERKNHFTSLIYQLLGISNLHMPENVLKIGKKAKTVEEVRDMLKKNGLSQYIPSAPRILESGNPDKFECTYSTRRIIEKLLRMFLSVERAWDRLKSKLAPKRKSFLNYNFVLRKLCDRIGQSAMCRDLKSLKSAQVEKNMNFYWKEIEKFLKWSSTEELAQKKFPVYALLPNKWNPSVQNGKFVKRKYPEHQKHMLSQKKQRHT